MLKISINCFNQRIVLKKTKSSLKITEPCLKVLENDIERRLTEVMFRLRKFQSKLIQMFFCLLSLSLTEAIIADVAQNRS